MDANAFIGEVSKGAKVEDRIARRVCKSLFQVLSNKIGKDERVNVAGFGAFIKKNTGDGERILFKPVISE